MSAGENSFLQEGFMDKSGYACNKGICRKINADGTTELTLYKSHNNVLASLKYDSEFNELSREDTGDYFTDLQPLDMRNE